MPADRADSTPPSDANASRSGYTRGVGKKKPTQRSSGKRNTPRLMRTSRPKYSAAELFMAAVGVLLIVLFVGIVVTSILGE